MSDLADEARDALRQVLDPEVAVNIVDLGLIYDIAVEGDTVRVTMTYTTEACPAGPSLVEAAEQAIANLPGKPKVQVEVTFDPPWTLDKITPEGRALLGR